MRRRILLPSLKGFDFMKTEQDYSVSEKDGAELLVYERLMQKGFTVTTAESLTGGLLAGRLINVSGASNVYNEGFITYSNEAKAKYLGVSEKTLAEQGAVSTECAEEMARGAQQRTGSDVALVTTGIAGPEGGSREKPVGLVYIGACVQGAVRVRELHLAGSRQEIRMQTVQKALELALEVLPEEAEKI